MSPGILGKRVSSMRMPTVKPYWLKPPPTRPEVIASYYMTRGHALLDHPIRPDQNAMRDRQPKRPGGLEINHHFKLCRLLDGKVCGLGALENFCLRIQQPGLRDPRDSNRTT